MRVVEPGGTYKLYPKVKNEGKATTPDKQMMVVTNKKDSLVDRVTEEPLNPSGNKDKVTFWDAYQIYQWNGMANCDSGDFWHYKCWEWGFKNLKTGGTVNSSLTFPSMITYSTSFSKSV